MKALGVILIVLGILALVYTGFEYTKKEKVLDVGPLEVSAEKEERVSWPPIVGVVLLAGGIIILITSRKT